MARTIPELRIDPPSLDPSWQTRARMQGESEEDERTRRFLEETFSPERREARLQANVRQPGETEDPVAQALEYRPGEDPDTDAIVAQAGTPRQQQQLADWQATQQMGIERGLALAQQADVRRTVSAPNPLRPAAEKVVETGGRALEAGRTEAMELQAEESRYQAGLARYAGEMERQADMDRVDMMARENARRESMAEHMERQRRAQLKIAEAAEDVARSEEIDPGRFWASRTDGQKVAIILGMVFSGLGGADPMGQINQSINRDIQAQRDEHARLHGVFGVRQQEAGEARNLYQQMLDEFGTQEGAEAAIRVARWQALKQQAATMEAKHGTLEAKIRGEALGEQIDAQIAQAEFDLDTFLQKVPSKLTATVSAYGPASRKFLGEAASGQLKAAQDLAKEMQKAGSQPPSGYKDWSGFRGDLAEYGKRREPYDTTIKEAERFRQKHGEDIAGRSSVGPVPRFLGGATEAGRKAQQDLWAIVFSYVKAESGAQVSDAEIARRAQVMMGEWGTEEEIMNGIDLIEAKMRDKAAATERSFVPEVVEYYHQAQQGQRTPELAARPGAVGGAMSQAGFMED